MKSEPKKLIVNGNEYFYNLEQFDSIVEAMEKMGEQAVLLCINYAYMIRQKEMVARKYRNVK